MLSVNKKRSDTGVTQRDYIKSVWNLERCAIDFLVEFKNLGRPDDYVERKRDEIKVEWVWLCRVLEHMGRFVVRLKAIKY